MTRSFLSTITGSFSRPAGENPTVAMVEAAYRALGLDARYLNCEVAPELLGDAVRGAVAQGWTGFNCSLPHKIAVIEHLDALAESARLIGAVNCVVVRDGRLVGENTDGKGFLASLAETVDPAGTRVVVLGAGGAARAIAFELALAGASDLTIVNRDADRGAALAAEVAQATDAVARALPWTPGFALPDGTDVLVNATSIGLAPDVDSRPDLDYGTLAAETVVADVIPNPARTAFLAEAERRGCRTVDGLGMLVNQGVLGIRLWTGRDADPEVMRQALAEAFG
ncbi:shikimate dehydrogenase [Agromyces sp. MMS24-K17]|uniref:shikimate dehydrogenase n=1 Tax=Agromyces sp. MMS24-K17 TaxID=3372850 RepID=UPI003754B5CC